MSLAQSTNEMAIPSPFILPDVLHLSSFTLTVSRMGTSHLRHQRLSGMVRTGRFRMPMYAALFGGTVFQTPGLCLDFAP